MKCHKCTEQIEVGEAFVQIPSLGNSYHWWFFHPGCFSEWNNEQELSIHHLQHIIEMAGQIH